MKLWTPSRDEPELLAWWGALLMVGRLAREDEVPWPVHIDQFDLLGRVDRSGSRLPIWVYRHRQSERDIYADAAGRTYRYRPTPNAAGAGRFDRCDVRTAIHLAGLAQAVDPVRYRAHRPVGSRTWAGEEDAPLEPAEPAAPPRPGRYRRARPRVPRRNRWLHAVPTVSA